MQLLKPSLAGCALLLVSQFSSFSVKADVLTLTSLEWPPYSSPKL
ncbi:ABC transporter, partial [Vibrio anguillarum]|nr:ABC transporter [Vibrio anguillarum]